MIITINKTRIRFTVDIYGKINKPKKASIPNSKYDI